MKAITPLRAALAAAAGAVLLAACGGGGGGAPVATDPPVAGTDVPASATSSSAGALAFVRSVAAASDNTAAPITVGDAVLATSDTDEPDPGI
jgi:hypothetical protein